MKHCYFYLLPIIDSKLLTINKMLITQLEQSRVLYGAKLHWAKHYKVLEFYS